MNHYIWTSVWPFLLLFISVSPVKPYFTSASFGVSFCWSFLMLSITDKFVYLYPCENGAVWESIFLSSINMSTGRLLDRPMCGGMRGRVFSCINCLRYCGSGPAGLINALYPDWAFIPSLNITIIPPHWSIELCARVPLPFFLCWVGWTVPGDPTEIFNQPHRVWLGRLDDEFYICIYIYMCVSCYIGW